MECFIFHISLKSNILTFTKRTCLHHKGAPLLHPERTLVRAWCCFSCRFRTINDAFISHPLSQGLVRRNSEHAETKVCRSQRIHTAPLLTSKGLLNLNKHGPSISSAPPSSLSHRSVLSESLSTEHFPAVYRSETTPEHSGWLAYCVCCTQQTESCTFVYLHKH